MFGSVGLPELIIIFTIALIIFGPRKLPELGKSLGKSLAEFKRASNELKHTLDEEIRLEEHKTVRAAEPPAATGATGATGSITPTPTPMPTPVAPAVPDEPHSVPGSVPRQNGSA